MRPETGRHTRGGHFPHRQRRMRNAFRQYFHPTETELRERWEAGLFSFDASVLLNIYGYSNDTRDDLVGLIERNSERVRLPHRFGLEYSRNRGSVIVKQVNNYLKAEKELEQIKNVYITPERDHPFLTKESLAAYEAIQTELAQSRKRLEQLIGSDPYAEKMLTVFEGRVSQAPSAEDLSKLHATAEERNNDPLGVVPWTTVTPVRFPNPSYVKLWPHAVSSDVYPIL